MDGVRGSGVGTCVAFLRNSALVTLVFMAMRSQIRTVTVIPSPYKHNSPQLILVKLLVFVTSYSYFQKSSVTLLRYYYVLHLQ